MLGELLIVPVMYTVDFNYGTSRAFLRREPHDRNKIYKNMEGYSHFALTCSLFFVTCFNL